MTKKHLIITISISALTTVLVASVFYYLAPAKTITIHEQLNDYDRSLLVKYNTQMGLNAKSQASNQFIESSRFARSAVCHIRVLTEKKSGPMNSEFTASNGSGVLLSNEGHIITNHHVIAQADKISVTLDNKSEYEATVLGIDESTDLAVLQIDGEQFSYLSLADSDRLDIGEWVLAIGNPFNMQSTVTAGIVSAKARNIGAFEKHNIEAFIQTDAAVNPGNSGGALVNSSGQLVGINTAILSASGGYEGFSFAIPSNIVAKVYTDILAYGNVQRAWLGVSIEEVSDQDAKSMNLQNTQGVKIKLVERQGAAWRAKLKKDDIILSINNKVISDAPSFMSEIALYRPGDMINMILIRDGNTINRSATLLNHLKTTDYVSIKKDGVLKQLGVEMRSMSAQEEDQLPKSGIKIVSVKLGSPANLANMEAGYIITSINGHAVTDLKRAVELIENTTDQGIEFDGYYAQYPGRYPYFIESLD